MKTSNNNINAPASKTAILLDAEREDSKFDFRRADEIFSMSEAEAYEQTDTFTLDESEVITLGHHKAVFLGHEIVDGKAITGRDGERYVTKAYLKMKFLVDGVQLESRLYRKNFDISFKKNINEAFRGLFKYTPESAALKFLEGKQIDIWVVWNDVLGELQAEYFDREAWEAERKERAKVGAETRRGSNSRPTENKATR